MAFPDQALVAAFSRRRDPFRLSLSLFVEPLFNLLQQCAIIFWPYEPVDYSLCCSNLFHEAIVPASQKFIDMK
jgi:hypothetical protein